MSFETIEHVADPDALLHNFWSALDEGGLFLVSTPNAAITSPIPCMRPANRYHLWEEDVPQFMARLERAGFKIIASYGQAHLRGLMWVAYRLARARGQLLAHGAFARVEQRILGWEAALVRRLQRRVVATDDDAAPSTLYPLHTCVYQVHVCQRGPTAG